MDYYTTNQAETMGPAAFIMFFMFYLFALAIGYVISSVLLARLFKKAGIEQWIAWVPIYNTWKLLEMGGQQGFWAVLALVPVVNIVSVVYMYIAMYYIGLKLGKEGWWIVIAILVPIVWLAILAFDDSKWQAAAPVEAPAK
jgi:Family of unknown function (DUF5684)